MKQSTKQKLFEEQGGKCFFCDKIVPIDALMFEHLLPKSLGYDDSASNLVLSCPECNMQRGLIEGGKLPFREIEFAYFLRQLLDKHPKFRNITQDALIAGEIKYRADLLVEQNIDGKWTKVLIEIKSLPTFISKRLDDVVNQLNRYKSFIHGEVKLVLSFPGILSQKDNEFLESKNIEVWDREYSRVKSFVMIFVSSFPSPTTFPSELDQMISAIPIQFFREELLMGNGL